MCYQTGWEQKRGGVNELLFGIEFHLLIQVMVRISPLVQPS
jgi:hypothetical protein